MLLKGMAGVYCNNVLSHITQSVKNLKIVKSTIYHIYVLYDDFKRSNNWLYSMIMLNKGTLSTSKKYNNVKSDYK